MKEQWQLNLEAARDAAAKRIRRAFEMMRVPDLMVVASSKNCVGRQATCVSAHELSTLSAYQQDVLDSLHRDAYEAKPLTDEEKKLFAFRVSERAHELSIADTSGKVIGWTDEHERFYYSKASDLRTALCYWIGTNRVRLGNAEVGAIDTTVRQLEEFVRSREPDDQSLRDWKDLFCSLCKTHRFAQRTEMLAAVNFWYMAYPMIRGVHPEGRLIIGG